MEEVQWFTISASGANSSDDYEDDFSYLAGLTIQLLVPLEDGGDNPINGDDTIVGGAGDDFLLVEEVTLRIEDAPGFVPFDTQTGLPGFADEWVELFVSLIDADSPFQVQAAALDETGSFEGDTAEQIRFEFLDEGMEILDGSEFRVRAVFASGNPGDYEVTVEDVDVSSPVYGAFSADRPVGSSSFVRASAQGRDLREGESRAPTNGDDLLYDPNGNQDNQGLDALAGNDTVFGGLGNDTLFGSAGDDELIGYDDVTGRDDENDGRDRLDGGSGNDMLDGGEGDDTLLGGSGNDTALGGGDRDQLFGGDGNDSLEGNNDADQLFGGGGMDVLVGGPGNDEFEGGPGDDVFFDVIGGNDTYRQIGAFGVDTLRDTSGSNTVEFNIGTELAFSRIEPSDLRVSAGLGNTLIVQDYFAGLSGLFTFRVGTQTVPVDLAPEDLELSNTAVAETATAGATVGVLSATDPEGLGLSFSLTDSAGGTFAVSGSDLVVARPLDFETTASYSIAVRATDPGGNTVEGSFTISVTDVDENEPPGAPQLSNNAAPENASVGTRVGTVSATDPNGDSLSYRLLDDAGGLFALQGDDLVVAGALDFETASSHSIRIEASDGVSASEATISVAVTDVPEPPTDLALDGLSAREGPSGVGTAVGRFTVTDPEGGSITYRLTDDADGRFSIMDDQLVVARELDFEAFTSHDVTAVAEDADGLTVVGLFTVMVEDVDETPGGGQRIEGTPTDDVLSISVSGTGDAGALGGNGNDTIDGLEGRDTVIYDLNRADIVEAVINPGQVSVVISGGQTDELNSIERIELGDGAYLYDVRPEATYTYLTYSAALGRFPDEGGLRFWDGLREDGLSDRALARSFVESFEFIDRFGGPEAPLEDFVCALFENVLERDGDEAGKAFWIGEIGSGRLDRVDMLQAFVLSPENLEKNADNYDDGVWVI